MISTVFTLRNDFTVLLHYFNNQILQQLAFQDCYVDCLEAKEYWKKIEGDGDDDNGDGPDHGCPLD